MIIDIRAHGGGVHCTRVRSAISLINGVQRYFYLRFQEDDRLKATGNPIDAATKCGEIEAVITDGPFILVTEDPLRDNWFSHEYRRSSIITLSDWESAYAPPSLKTYLIYQIAQSAASFASDLSEEMALNLAYQTPEGCMFDLAIEKAHIKFGMLSGNLCPRCEGQLKTLGLSDEAIDATKRILALVRAEAVGKPVLFNPTYAFVVMRFSTNDENDNAWKHGIMRGLQEAGYDAARADARVESGQILEKISRQIRRSRMVIAKIDENNLNVYFKLGLATGMEKDVLLISESSLVLNLPSDLRNWECLTYDRGDYDQLKERVRTFLRQTYHM
jgi:hypothetical protein